MAEGRQSEIRRSSEYANELQGSVSFLSLGEEDEQSLEPHQYPQCSTPPHTTQVGVGTSAVTQQRLQLQSQSMPRTKVGTMPSGKQSQEIPASCDDSSRNEHQRKPRTDSRKLVRPQTAPSSKTFRKPERPADSDDELASLLERTRIKDDEGPEQLAIGAKGSTTSVRRHWCWLRVRLCALSGSHYPACCLPSLVTTEQTRILRGPDGKPIFVWDKVSGSSWVAIATKYSTGLTGENL